LKITFRSRERGFDKATSSAMDRKLCGKPCLHPLKTVASPSRQKYKKHSVFSILVTGADWFNQNSVCGILRRGKYCEL
jgi:hypothetical protein